MSKDGGPARGGEPEWDVVVVGAGFAGLYAIHRFREAGLKVLGLEKGGGVGGVWYWNRYPGARCDCESYYYSYAFSEALQQDWNWSLRYSEQGEILRYLEHVADRFDLHRHIRFDAALAEAVFDEAELAWRARTADGFETSCRFLVTAMGCLSTPHEPGIKGLASFAGATWRTSQWPHDGVDFTDRRVAVIGTGASGVQAIPRIARQARSLTVFQRTANWVLPARNAPTAAEFDAWVKTHYADIRAACLASPGAVPFEAPSRSALATPEDERRATYERLWQVGGLRFFTAFTDLFTSLDANETAQAFVRDKIRSIVRDPAIADRLIPVDHPIGVKRPPVDDDYYATFNLPHVELVDLRRTPIVEVRGREVLTSESGYELDDLVLATGFDAMTGSLLAPEIRGRGGQRLADAWSEGPATYLGLATAGFPNLFTITGPLSPSVLANMPTAVEQHVDWIADCVAEVSNHPIPVIEATADAQSAWTAHAAEVVSHTLYPKSRSWYFGSNIPGKPTAFGVYVGGFAAYRERCAAVADAGWEGFRLGASTVAHTASMWSDFPPE
ncbi:MAG: flavin-containing monooxygenase [Caulobacteraceae bacterium]